MMVQRGYSEKNRPCILWLDEAPTENHLKALLETYGDEFATHFIIVIPHKSIPPGLWKYAASNPNTRIELFLEIQLQFPVINHVLVPKHTVLTAKERKALVYTQSMPCRSFFWRKNRRRISHRAT
jgi:hypothetical protein